MALTFEQLLRMDLVTSQVTRVTAWVAETFGDDLGPHLSWRAGAGFYDSPLEVVFDMWWRALHAVEHIGDQVEFTPQHMVTVGGSTYRLDFLLEPDYDAKVWLDSRGYSWPKIAVELDGHEFHEKTKEQVTYRNLRDRDLQAAGWVVFHFSGSELVRDPVTCVTECYQRAQSAFWLHKRSIETAEGAADTKSDAQTSQES